MNRRLYSLVLLVGLPTLSSVGGDVIEAPRATPWASRCQILCANLVTAIRERPDTLEMRLEDALVINESCAPEIITAAMDAVRAKPALVQKILETAIKMVPSRTTMMMEVVHSYVPASEIRPAIIEEVRTAIVEDAPPLQEEIRRAELPTTAVSTPIEEIRRAEVVR